MAQGSSTESSSRPTLGSYAGLDGQPLDSIEGKEVEVKEIQVSTRRLRDDPNHAYAVIVLTTGEVFHTWSEFLCEQLAAVPRNALPGKTTFRKVTTDKRREVWKMD